MSNAPCDHCGGTGRQGGIYGTAVLTGFCQWCQGTGEAWVGMPIPPDHALVPLALIKEAVRWFEDLSTGQYNSHPTDMKDLAAKLGAHLGEKP